MTGVTSPVTTASDAPPFRVVVLGSTGSIGVNTLEVIDHLNALGPRRWEVVGLSAGANAQRLSEQAARHPRARLALAHGDAPAGSLSGPDAAERLIRETPADLVVSAIVGFAGLRPTAAALARGRRVALANKETLVAGGRWVTDLAQTHGGRIDPIDSEHSAIGQCFAPAGGGLAPAAGGLAPAAATPGHPAAVASVTLTASGGPFLDTDPATLAAATPEMALQHPTWSMGPKITIDSATLMNKALEVIEAHHLFGLPADRIHVVIHPQSVVHGFVTFTDGAVLAHLGPPDMRGAIQHALTGGQRVTGCGSPLDLATLGTLDFRPPDEARFPALALARRVIRDGGTAGATLNGANEAAVYAFLERRLAFTRIVPLVAAALDALPTKPIHDLDTLVRADRAARAWVDQQIDQQTKEQPAIAPVP